MIKSSIISKLVIETSRCMSSLGAKPTVYMTRIVSYMQLLNYNL